MASNSCLPHDELTATGSFALVSVASISHRVRSVARSIVENRPGSRAASFARETVETGSAESGKDADESSVDTFVEPTSPYAGLTLRALVVGVALGAVFNIIVLNLALTTGIIPSLNIAAGLLGFFILKVWVKVIGCINSKWGGGFTPQENTVVQTSCVSCYGLAFYGGFSSYLLGMDSQTQQNLGDMPGNSPDEVVEPTIPVMIPYMFCIALIGIFMLVSLREVFIIKYNLPYPSGTATGIMIESFHNIGGAASAMKQIKVLFKWLVTSFIWGGYKWIFSGGGCDGFDNFPTFGLQAAAQTWLFDFSLTYVGCGMITPYFVNYSLMVGAIIGHGILWPILTQKAGDWYPAGLSSYDFQGLYGYQTFIAISIFLADGLYNISKIFIIGGMAFYKQQFANVLPTTTGEAAANAAETKEASMKSSCPETVAKEAARKRVFLRDAIPWYVGLAGYVVLAVLGIIVIPILFSQVKWYYVLVGYIMAPVLAVPNCYGAGLTDWNVASLYGKLAIFIFSAWAGPQGGVIAGLGMCGVLFVAAGSASDLMQDFRTGYITMAPPRAMFIAQVIGALSACLIAPAVFLMFQSAFPLGDPTGSYPAPYANIYRAMALVGVDGISVLPDNCLWFCMAFFLFSIALDFARDFLPKKFAAFVPIPTAMAITFYLPASIAVDTCVGAVIKFIWGYLDPADMELFAPIVASGLIAGEGIWSLPSALLGIGNVQAPICMSFSKAAS